MRFIYRYTNHLLSVTISVPDQFIYGIAPSEAFLKKDERNLLFKAMEHGMNIVNPLHEFFTEDEEFIKHAKQFDITIQDIRKPAQKKDMHLFSGRILNINTPIVAVLGTDSAIGKRTTSVLLEDGSKSTLQKLHIMQRS